MKTTFPTKAMARFGVPFSSLAARFFFPRSWLFAVSRTGGRQSHPLCAQTRKPRPEFKLDSIDGKPLTLARARMAKVVLLKFLGHVVRAMPRGNSGF